MTTPTTEELAKALEQYAAPFEGTGEDYKNHFLFLAATRLRELEKRCERTKILLERRTARLRNYEPIPDLKLELIE